MTTAAMFARVPFTRMTYGSAACWSRIIVKLRSIVRARIAGRELVKAFQEMEEFYNV